MQLKIRIFAVCLTAAVALPAFAADNPWFGTWKLDLAKSHITGATFTYSKTTGGMDQYSNGSITFVFTANGIDYPLIPGATLNWVVTGPNQWKETDKTNGAVTGTSDIRLTPNCKTMTVVSTGTRPDGTSFHDESTYTKVKSDGCLEGTWKDIKASQSAPPESVIAEGSSPGAWKWETPAWKQVIEGKPDGSELTMTGPTVPPGITVAFKSENPRTLTYQVKANGKVVGQGEQVLSANGKTYTDTTWTPGKENEKATYVYNKQ